MHRVSPHMPIHIWRAMTNGMQYFQAVLGFTVVTGAQLVCFPNAERALSNDRRNTLQIEEVLMVFHSQWPPRLPIQASKYGYNIRILVTGH